MDKNKLTFCQIIGTIIKTFVVIAVVIIAIALIAPFVLFGPNDEFWLMVKYGQITYESDLIHFYYNILQWIATSR